MFNPVVCCYCLLCFFFPFSDVLEVEVLPSQAKPGSPSMLEDRRIMKEYFLIYYYFNRFSFQLDIIILEAKITESSG
jgi:hypothetical protein